MNISMLCIGGWGIFGIAAAAVVVIFVVIACCLIPLKQYFAALFAGCHISSFKLCSARLRKIDVKSLTQDYILFKRLGIELKFEDVEGLVVAGIDVKAVARAAKVLKTNGKDVSFEALSSMALAGEDMAKHAQMFEPSELSFEVTAITGDHVLVKVSVLVVAKYSHSADISESAPEVIKSQVMEYVVGQVGQIRNNSILLETPERVFEKFGEAAKNFDDTIEIISASVVGVEILKNIDVEMEKLVAERDLARTNAQIAREKLDAEKNEAQLRAATEEMKARVLEAEAAVPEAISQAISDGRFTVMDYYKLMNLQADTAMRRAVALGDKQEDVSDTDAGMGGDDYDE